MWGRGVYKQLNKFYLVAVLKISNFATISVAIYLNMETKHKATYIAPSTLVFEVVQEGVVCQSPGGVGGTRNGYGDAIEDEWA